MPPNMPMPTMVACAEPTAKFRLRNSRSGSSASSPARLSTRTNAAMPNAPST